MTAPASPATRLHDVVVIHEQTHAQWRAAGAKIANGRIVVKAGASKPPGGLFEARGATYSIQAVDGARRARCFPNLVLARGDSHPPEEYVFD